MLVVYVYLVLTRTVDVTHGRAEETQLSSSLRCKAESFLPVIDQFIASLDQRLQAYKLLAGRWSIWLPWLSVNIISRRATHSCQDTR